MGLPELQRWYGAPYYSRAPCVNGIFHSGGRGGGGGGLATHRISSVFLCSIGWWIILRERGFSRRCILLITAKLRGFYEALWADSRQLMFRHLWREMCSPISECKWKTKIKDCECCQMLAAYRCAGTLFVCSFTKHLWICNDVHMHLSSNTQSPLVFLVIANMSIKGRLGCWQPLQ